MARILVWDLPTRLFHWLFALAFLAAYLLGEEDGLLGWHSYFGYILGGLALFRVMWGFVGGRYSRFAAFPPDPAGAWRYLREMLAGSAPRHLGHNPAGALAIYALLLLGVATALSGVALMGADKGVGPLAGIVPGSLKEGLEALHEFCANAMLLVVLLHLAGVAAGSLLHRENLPRSMVTGRKDRLPETGEAKEVPLRALVAGLMLAGLVTFTFVHDFSAGCDANPAACETGEHGQEHGRKGHDDA